jgi:hypothetical protein
VTNKYRGKNSFHELRHFIPLFFVFYIISLLIAYTIPNLYSTNFIVIFSLPIVIYSLSIIIVGISQMLKRMNLIYLLIIPFTFILLHSSYGLGSIRGFFSLKKTNYEKK